MGQINYSGSNAFLDGLARHRKALGKPGMVVQWGAWGEVGMAASLDAASKLRFANSPQPPFLNREGLAGLQEGIRSGVAYFSAFKFNPTAQLALVQGNTSVNHAFMRNFYTNSFPLPHPQDDCTDVYDIVRAQTGGTAVRPITSGLVFRYTYGEPDNSDNE
mmetsp:Transcript_72784/g.157975  ORF Transcript_72784/g.157975 Transcript_72784/m.157975 type:complete len:161 (+) Transcript_72784:3-485(+)